MIDLREVMRRWVTGVSIVTVESEGHKHGATVSSFTSVSVDPPLVTVTLAKSTRTHQFMNDAGVFGVTLLSHDQRVISERFAGNIPDGQDRFEGVLNHYISMGIPVLDGGLAFLGCRIVHQYEMAKSTLFVGEVIAADLGEDKAPLVYVNRMYRRLED
jgi:flavin reductase (DIM6/NTAB) family NADH-FMN oxidoreductase RutF